MLPIYAVQSTRHSSDHQLANQRRQGYGPEVPFEPQQDQLVSRAFVGRDFISGRVNIKKTRNPAEIRKANRAFGLSYREGLNLIRQMV